jgi:hypothetical protein
MFLRIVSDPNNDFPQNVSLCMFVVSATSTKNKPKCILLFFLDYISHLPSVPVYPSHTSSLHNFGNLTLKN